MANEKKKKKDSSDRRFGEPNALAAKFDLGHMYEDSDKYYLKCEDWKLLQT